MEKQIIYSHLQSNLQSNALIRLARSRQSGQTEKPVVIE